jgi:hypothetical protein
MPGLGSPCSARGAWAKAHTLSETIRLPLYAEAGWLPHVEPRRYHPASCNLACDPSPDRSGNASGLAAPRTHRPRFQDPAAIPSERFLRFPCTIPLSRASDHEVIPAGRVFVPQGSWTLVPIVCTAAKGSCAKPRWRSANRAGRFIADWLISTGNALPSLRQSRSAAARRPLAVLGASAHSRCGAGDGPNGTRLESGARLGGRAAPLARSRTSPPAAAGRAAVREGYGPLPGCRPGQQDNLGDGPGGRDPLAAYTRRTLDVGVHSARVVVTVATALNCLPPRAPPALPMSSITQ